MQTFDASSIIYAWDNYPERQFPPLWDWVAAEIQLGFFSIPSIAFEQVGHKTPDCKEWLTAASINRLPMTNEILQEAMRIKTLLGIQEDRYSPKGVDENDLLIIATTSIEGLVLISNEAKQATLPRDLANMKIPAVCADARVDVECIDFITLIKQSEQVFR